MKNGSRYRRSEAQWLFKPNGEKYIQVIGDTARISGTGQITAIVSDYSCPSISAGGWPGIRFSSILESPLWSRMATLFTRWSTFSPSPCPVWRARALPSLRNCSRATLCQPPRDSATMGMNLIPCSLHSSSVSLHLFSNATVIACPGVAAAPALVAAWRGCVMVTSRAASSPPADLCFIWTDTPQFYAPYPPPPSFRNHVQNCELWPVIFFEFPGSCTFWSFI